MALETAILKQWPLKHQRKCVLALGTWQPPSDSEAAKIRTTELRKGGIVLVWVSKKRSAVDSVELVLRNQC
jgi:hypothetical protein